MIVIETILQKKIQENEVTKALITDVSFYEDDAETPRHIDFNKMKSAGVSGTIIRAGQNLWKDTSFAQSWMDAKKAGLPRGSYWFLDSRANMKAQAMMYVDIHKGDFGELPLCLDFEKLNNVPDVSGSMLKEVLEEVKRLVPNKEIMIYTGYWYWKDHVPASMFDYFKGYPLWVAAYNNIGPTLPAPFTSHLFWQFTEDGNGSVYGIEGSVDLNYFNGDEAAFRTRFNVTDKPVEPPVSTDAVVHTHAGVSTHILTRFGTRCFVHVVDPKVAKVKISNCGFRTPSYAQEKYNAQIVTNGGGWPNVQDASHRSNEMWVSDGIFMQQPSYIKDNRPYINVKIDGEVSVSPDAKTMLGLYNAVGFDRILLWDGVYNSRITENVKDARTGCGKTADGKFVILSAEGNDLFGEGLSFYEMSRVFLEFGVTHAGNNDGGSSTNVHNTALSSEPLFKGSDGAEAPVINHIMVFATPTGETIPEIPEGEPPMATDEKYEVIVSARYRSLPTTTTNDTGASSIVGDQFFALAVQADIKDSFITMVQHPNGKWLPVFAAGKEFTRWINKPVDPVPDPTVPAQVDVRVTVRNANVVDVYVNDVKYKKE